jgi:hypothetical protein
MRALRTIAILPLLLAGCGGSGGGGGGAPVALATRYPIDGVVDFTGLSTSTATIAFNGGSGFVKNTTITWAMTNDDVDLYLALEWTDDTFNHAFDATGPTDLDGLYLLFDDDGNGTFDSGEDDRFLIAALNGSLYGDQHKGSATGDRCGDGYGKLTYDAAAQKYHAEILLPLADDAQGEDATIGPTTRFNIVLQDHVQPAMGTGNVADLFPSESVSNAWGTVPYLVSPVAQRPQLPAGLTGLIVFTSDRDDPNTEIYTFDPATRVVTRVTNDSIFEDNVSLSHDRQWIAFHAAPNYLDFANYEVWKIRVDGTGLTQLTNNAILDGHPGWSPDDSKICYASFRDSGPASIVVMTSDGTELADLTSLPDDDNDPDFLLDGRIVFKTTRFHPAPQVKIATMNADGTGVQEVTFDAISPATSDHDCVGDPTSTFCVFERFTKGTDYSTDLEAGFSPWNLIEARVDGTAERTLLADGWVDYLPVYDPTGRYVLYLQAHGFTECRLLTRAGQDLGRLIPNDTKMHYVDWK